MKNLDIVERGQYLRLKQNEQGTLFCKFRRVPCLLSIIFFTPIARSITDSFNAINKGVNKAKGNKYTGCILY